MKEFYQKEKISPNSNYFVQNLESKLYRIALKKHFSKMIFICIGTNKIIGDSFGPMVGENLKNKFQDRTKIQVYGTVNEPVHFLNAQRYLEIFENKNACTIAIDSAFDTIEKIGNTYVSWGGMSLGKAFQKELYFPAHMSIKTIIAEDKKSIKDNFDCITKCESREIEELAFQVAEGIYLAISKIKI